MSSMLLYGQVQTKTSTRASLLCLFFDRLLFPRAGHSEAETIGQVCSEVSTAFKFHTGRVGFSAGLFSFC